MHISKRHIFFMKLFAVMVVVVVAHGISILFIAGHNIQDYNKCIGSPQKNIIIGTSRASQALQPSELKKVTGQSFFNFAFNGSLSKYGDVYNAAIFKKLDTTASQGTFILAVDPWSLAVKKGDELDFPLAHDQQNYLNQLTSFTGSMNLSFLYHNYNYGWMHLIWDYYKSGSLAITHEDGWMEIVRDTAQARIEERKGKKLLAKQKEIVDYAMSTYRLESLKKLILYLKSKGSVYLIRLPISKEFYQLENGHFTTFEKEIQSIVNGMGVSYWDMVSIQDSVKYNDGHHINRLYAPYISARVGEWINEEQTKKAK